MEKCIFCKAEATVEQAQDWGTTYDGWDIDCNSCGLVRASGPFIENINIHPEVSKQCAKYLQNRSPEEKKQRFHLTIGMDPNAL